MIIVFFTFMCWHNCHKDSYKDSTETKENTPTQVTKENTRKRGYKNHT